MTAHSATILVVDDEVEIQQLLRRHFTFAGHVVHLAGNGMEALELLGRHRVDVVVSDIVMPEMGGVELLEHMRAAHPLVRAVMMTGYVTQQNILACMRLGADSCVFKPFETLDKLDEALDRSLRMIAHWLEVLDVVTNDEMPPS